MSISDLIRRQRLETAKKRVDFSGQKTDTSFVTNTLGLCGVVRGLRAPCAPGAGHIDAAK